MKFSFYSWLVTKQWPILTFTLSLLAKHPDMLAEAKKEIVQVANGNLTSLETIGALNYIKSCIEESMRLYPPAWITDRVAVEDDTLGYYHIKKVDSSYCLPFAPGARFMHW